MTLIATGCSTAEQRVSAAAEAAGRAQAGVTIPDPPEDCRVQEPHADITVGVELRSVLKRERGALDRANARVGRCAALWDDIKQGLAVAPTVRPKP